MPTVAVETMDEDGVQQGPLPLRLGVSARNVQLMKASFFSEDVGEPGKGKRCSRYWENQWQRLNSIPTYCHCASFFPSTWACRRAALLANVQIWVGFFYIFLFYGHFLDLLTLRLRNVLKAKRRGKKGIKAMYKWSKQRSSLCLGLDQEARSPWHKGEGRLLKSGEKAMPTLFNTTLGIKPSLTPPAMSPDPKELVREKKSKSVFWFFVSVVVYGLLLQ